MTGAVVSGVTIAPASGTGAMAALAGPVTVDFRGGTSGAMVSRAGSPIVSRSGHPMVSRGAAPMARGVTGGMSLQPGGVLLSPPGITKTDRFGTAVETPGAATVRVPGRANTNAEGILRASPGAASVVPVGIAKHNLLGTQLVRPGVITVTMAGKASTDLFGIPRLTPTAEISPPAIPSRSKFGTAIFSPGIVMTGCPRTSVMGSLAVGSVATIHMIGLASNDRFGTFALHNAHVIRPVGIAAVSEAGYFSIDPGAVNILMIGINNDARQPFKLTSRTGRPIFTRSGHQIVTTGAADKIGIFDVVEGLYAFGIASTSALGVPTIITTKYIGIPAPWTVQTISFTVPSPVWQFEATAVFAFTQS